MTWLILDCDYLCHRAFYAMTNLSYGGERTEVIYAFLRDVVSLRDRFGTDGLVFAFDCGKSLRRKLYPLYKANRQTDVKYNICRAETKKELHRQIKHLRNDVLAEAGFHNVFFKKGYEADDIIASITHNTTDEIIIVASDHDLYQLFKKNVSIYDPRQKKLLTKKWFTDTYRIPPSSWIDVKAIAGCSTDNIKGVYGVGEITAVKYLTGTLSKTAQTYQAITSKNGTSIWQRNLAVVKLPFPGTPTFELRQDVVSVTSWNRLVASMGMGALNIH